MTDMLKKLSEEEMHNRILDYVGYVLTSARAIYREPHSYSPMRMVDSLEKSLNLLRDAGIKDDSVEESMTVIRENRWRVTSDPEAFANALDEAILRLVRVTLQESGTTGE
ncbi:DUF6092 family protein [Paenibacillus alginolyticus]|uniref:DUF6092 family protein n=1 Tax=Paenibacillus alginolyticus TaxID=59839 RepID=A0ABT4GK92_9BACL|nr:DUF6092 family protein [Paenibacillus alginolyticus]MCY9670183.1 DUF6092 family protein [Paenibacillus alginolyticus]MCY9696611.1 DUF6092 family protein [Paenibacillus alginolyticus]MEC0145222.1 DUF6092 family protein [Paenibacillus alginolyticus]